MAKKKPLPNPDEPEKPRVHKELEGFNIEINSFGEIVTSFEIDKINQFLNRTVDDKKLRHRDDLKALKGESPDSDDDADEADDPEKLFDETDDILPDEGK
ncbi:hypothetical protein [Fibrella aquatilis]|uniref:Uncharacterized protein n=1 Tax=Fibrella aquatilis TaxID=2817059 RepID=A0A939G8Z0_9BACT|nr:hypothetical protein [Fibrella aquatilis]MBO0933418.1 hypothetical protein [Fibrella aquatilis]